MPNTLEELEIVVKGNIKDAVAKLEELKAKIQEKVTAEFTKMQPAISQTTNALSTTISKSAKQFDFLGKQIEIQRQKVQKLRSEFEKSISVKGLDTNKLVENYSKQVSNGNINPSNLYMQLESAELKLDQLKSKAQNTAEEMVTPFQNAMPKISGFVSKMASGIWNSIKKVTSKIGNSINKLFSPITNLIKRFKRLATVMLFRSIIRQAIAGFQDLAQYSNKFNSSMSEMQASFLQMRNSITTAFAPVLQALVPIIQAVTNAITELFTKVAQLTSALFGNSTTFTKAKKVTTDYAKSVGKATQANKGMLASFDELNVISAQSGNNTGMPSPTEMFEEADIESPILDFTNRIKDAIKQGDWYGVGAILGNKVNEMFEGLQLDEAGTKLGEKINNAFNVALGFLRTVNWAEFGSSIASGLNNLISSINFTTLGQTLGAGLNAILYTAEGFITTFNWSNAGKSISDAINGFFTEFDFAVLAQSISDFCSGILDMYIGFWENTDWELVADKLSEFFANIKWDKIVHKMAEGLGAKLGGFSRLVVEFLIVNPAEGLAKYFYEKMQECGGNAWEGFCKGIVDALYNLGKFIVEDMFWPFINSFKEAFGIHSPSTVMAEMGTFIVQGLFEGISSLIDTILTPFEDIIAKIEEVWGKVVTWFNTNVVTPISDFFGGLWEGIETGASKLADVIDKNVIKPIVDSFKGMYNSVIGIMETLINGFIWLINGFIRGLNSVVDVVNSLGVGLPRIKPMDKVSIPRLAKGAVLEQETLFIGGEYPNAKSNPEIVTPQSLMYETNMKANIPVINAIEEMTDTMVEAFKSMGVYAEFDYDKLRVGLNNANYRAGEKLYGV